jgi:arylsulfatase A-like enzyme
MLKFLDEQRAPEKPLFIFMSYRSPHAHEYFLRETENYKDRGWPEIERRHASRITMLDGQIGRLLDRLEQMGELDNAFILFTSDNGPHGEGRHDRMFFNGSGGLKGFKRDMYEGGIRVPGIVYWKGHSRQGISDHPAIFYDIMPTLAEVAGIEVPAQTDGISFLPEVLGRAQEKHDHLYWELQLADGSPQGFRQAVRKGDWKAVRYSHKNGTELYNLKEDPFEEKDVAARYPEVLERMNRMLAEESLKTDNYPCAGQGVE